MNKKKEIIAIRNDIQLAMQIADELREDNRAYRETLQTIFDDESIRLEVRQQYARRLVQQLTKGGVF
jgi:hypothetical protein